MKNGKRLYAGIGSILVVILTSASAAAQTPDPFRRFEIYAAPYSFARQGSLNSHGTGVAIAVNLTESLALVADLDFHQATHQERRVRIFQGRAGPKLVLNRAGRLTAFGQVLAGRAVVTQGVGELFGNPGPSYDRFTGFSLLVGGGVDVSLRDWLSIRVAEGGYSSLYVDNLEDAGWSHGIRLSGGLIFRF